MSILSVLPRPPHARASHWSAVRWPIVRAPPPAMTPCPPPAMTPCPPPVPQQRINVRSHHLSAHTPHRRSRRCLHVVYTTAAHACCRHNRLVHVTTRPDGVWPTVLVVWSLPTCLCPSLLVAISR